MLRVAMIEHAHNVQRSSEWNSYGIHNLGRRPQRELTLELSVPSERRYC